MSLVHEDELHEYKDLMQKTNFKKLQDEQQSEASNTEKDSIITPFKVQQADAAPSPSANDEDIEKHADAMTNELSAFCSGFRKDIMNHLTDLKTGLVKRYHGKIQKLEQEREVQATETKIKTEKMQDSINKRDHLLVKHKMLMNRLAQQYAWKNQKNRHKYLLQLTLDKWRQYATKKRMIRKWIDTHLMHRQKAQLRTMLHAWRTWVVTSKNQTTHLMWETKMDSTNAQLKNDYEAHIDKLERQIERLEHELAAEGKEKIQLQEKLKKELLRGVCALNNKFLEIIKDANQQDDHVDTQSSNNTITMEDTLANTIAATIMNNNNQQHVTNVTPRQAVFSPSHNNMTKIRPQSAQVVSNNTMWNATFAAESIVPSNKVKITREAPTAVNDVRSKVNAKKFGAVKKR